MLLIQKHLTFLLFLISCFAFAQQGSLKGNVVFDNNEPVFGAHIILTGANLTKETVTDLNGDYLFKNVPFGSYSIQMHSLNAKSITIVVSHNSEKVVHNTVIKFAEYQDLAEVLVKSKTTQQKIEEKGFAANVIETQDVMLQSVQVNDLLDQSAGVRVRQSGGMGSQANYNLNGMSGNSVKIFIDGVPIGNFGPSFSLNSIPPSMIKRIEVYKGVVPAHLSDDAMGGAINVILNQTMSDQLAVSISAGSFGTYRADVNGGFRNEKNGFTVRSSAFINYSDNDYHVWGDQVAVTLEPGTPDVYITAKRFHDRYRSQGFKADFGFTDVKWADKFMVGALLSNMDNQIQTGATMEIVYGNRHSEQNTKMFNVDYAKVDIVKNLDLSVFASFSELNRKTIDTIATQYSWLGHPTYYYGDPDEWASGAEAGDPTLQKDIDKTISNRTNLAYNINENNKVQINYLLNTFSRDSDDPMLPTIENELQEERKYMKNIIAPSYENEAFDNKLKTTVFVKSYLMNRTAKIRERSGNTSNSTIIVNEYNVKSNDIGYGGASSYAFTPSFNVFGSAEKAVRLPTANEVYGNVASNVNPSPNLKPEYSNNYNLGISFTDLRLQNHNLGISTNAFVRDTKDYIMEFPVGNDEEFFESVNVGKVYTTGLDFELKYNFDNFIFFNGNVSYFDARDYTVTYDVEGNPITPDTYERLANTPYFTMNYNLKFKKIDLIQKGSLFSCYANVLYVHEFFRHGNTLGGFGKTVIPTQIATDLGFAYTFPKNKITVSFDVRNVFNNQIFDNYALQKPGRGYYGKLTYSIF